MESFRNESVVTTYVEGWNDHDAEAIIDTFAPEGTYTDPQVEGTLTGNEIGEYAATMWEAFPDLSFDIERLTAAGGDVVLLQWTMRGTQEGPLEDLPPTGETTTLPGVDVFEVGNEGIRKVQGYWNAATVMEQVGHRVDVQPERFGPVSFGTAARLDLEKTAKPGAFSLTYIAFRDAEDEESIIDRVRDIITEMIELEGVISAIFARDGERGYTITAWEDPEDARQLMHKGTHQTAVEEMFERDGLGAAGMVSIWTPERMLGRQLRCPNCLEMTYEVEADSCPTCEAGLPEAPPHW